jgi:dolichol-phosphate mannosyltransferase
MVIAPKLKGLTSMNNNGNGFVSIIIPTYNEQDNIQPLVEKLNSSLKQYNYEIVFVDDNSRDGTAETINNLSSTYPVRLIERKNKRGLASAVVDGIKATRGEEVVVMDADLQHPPEVVPGLIQTLKDHDLAVGSRYCKGGSPGEWKYSRKVVSTVANLMALPLAPGVKDRMSGFFAFRRQTVNPDSLNPVGWKIGLEVIARGHYKAVTEVPYTFEPRQRGTSKLSRRIIWEYLKQLVQLYLNKFQITNFMIVGGIGYIINIAVYSLLTLNMKSTQSTFLGQHFYLAPFVASSLIAITSNYLLNKAWTFKGWKEKRMGGLRYLIMALATLLLDMAFLALLVDWGGMQPIPAAALAILIVFIVRFLIARKWIWAQKTI